MPRSDNTRASIVSAAFDLMRSSTVSGASVDRICEIAGVTKKTFYYHFKSKDEVLEAVLIEMKPQYIAKFRKWADEAGADADVNNRMHALFEGMAREAAKPEWQGCCVLQVAATLGNKSGHPARKMAAEANTQLETWIASELSAEGHRNPTFSASQILMLINGFIITGVVHRDNRFLNNALSMIDTLIPSLIIS